MLKDIRKNPILLTDAYNLSHQRLKVSTDWEVSHIYNRKEGMILYGFNEIVNDVLTTQITDEMIYEADKLAHKMGIKFPLELFKRVVDECNGYFPLEVQSVMEGAWCPKGTPFAQVRNTVEGFGELVTWLEGVFLQASFPSGCATEAFHMRRYLEKVKHENSFDDSFLIRLHSFGFRGHRSLEDAYWAGSAWNLFLFGTDDFHTMQHTPDAKMGSISALAHKVTQQFDNEYDGYIHTINATVFAGEKIVALVIDTYDADRFISEYLFPLSVHAQKLGVHLVIRPDSGDILEQTVEVYKQTQRHDIKNVSVIIGENMSYHNVKRYDLFFQLRQVPLTFVSYGIGGGFYNHINRDTLGFAMKTAYSNGKPRMKFGMDALKRSIPDKVELVYHDTLSVRREDERTSIYKTIYFHDDTLKSPKVENQKWETTQSQGLIWLRKEVLQERIELGEDIQELVKEFEKTYGQEV